MSVPRKNSLALVSSKYFNQKVRFSINRRQSRQLVRVLKKNLKSTSSSGAIQELRDSVYFKADKARKAGNGAGATIAVSGPVGREGATTVSLLLFLSLGELKNRKVLYIDGSFDSERFATYRELFNLKKIPIQCGDGQSFLSYYSSIGSNLCFLSISNMDPMDFFSNSDLDSLLEEFKACFDYVVFDMPPFLRFSETKFFFPKVDLSLLVVAPGKTLSDDVARCQKVAKEVGARLDGVILNRQHVPFWTRFFGREAFV